MKNLKSCSINRTAFFIAQTVYLVTQILFIKQLIHIIFDGMIIAIFLKKIYDSTTKPYHLC